jgi:threonine dehydratase
MATKTGPTLADIEAARERIGDRARMTAVYGSEALTSRTGREIVLKAENLQRTGSFKIRGAVNILSSLSPAEREAGVLAASAGNHGQAVAYAARELGVRATIVMPQDAPMSKVDPTLRYGAEAVLHGASFDDALAEARRRVEATGATLIHAFEDERVIAGQGTIGLELAEQLGDDVETLLIPVGGGGLASGIAIAMRALRPEVRLIGVHTERGQYTIADGIAVKYPGEMTMRILEELLDELVVVGDEEISESIALLLERSKLVVEGAGAVGVAALLTGKVGGTGSVCALLSGGNIDPTLLIPVMRHGLSLAGRILVIRSRLTDRPGELIKLLRTVAEQRANIVAIEHRREGVALQVADVGIELTLITRNEEHCLSLIAGVEAAGFPVDRQR